MATDQWSTQTRETLRLRSNDGAAVANIASRMTTLEPRVLFSATPIDVAALNVDEAAMVVAMESAQGSESQQNQFTTIDQLSTPQASSQVEIIIIDALVPDLQRLLDDFSQSQRNVEVYVLDGTRDGIVQITEILDGRADVDALHVISHGENGRVRLGSHWIGQDNLDGYAGQIASWQASLSSDADILFYGCDLAATGNGVTFLDSIAALTGADVAASDDTTGHADFGGNWSLEHHVGIIDHDSIVSQSTQSTWFGKLATFTVQHNVDEINDPALLSLRDAILAANAASGQDTIVLSATTYEILLTGSSGGELTITDDLIILVDGGGAATIDGNGLDRVFKIDGATVTMSNLVITGGDKNDGGGIKIESDGHLTLNQVVVTGNMADVGAGIHNNGELYLTDVTVSNNGSLADTSFGGGLYNDGIASFERVTFFNNRADKGGGLYHNDNAGSLTISRTTFSGNQADGDGGGLYLAEDATIVHATITANSAGNQGGGIYIDKGDTTIVNSIVDQNTSGSFGTDVRGGIDSRGNNIFGSSGGLTGTIASDRVNQSAGLMALADNGGFVMTHQLNTGSVAINAGTFDGASVVDARGLYVVDGRNDIGAVERGGVLTDRIYFVDRSGNAIRSANRDGSGVAEILTGLNGPTDLFIDVVNKKIYWSEPGQDRIRRADLNGTNVETFLSGLTSPQMMAIDYATGSFFWIENSFSTNRIRRSDLDGSNITTVVSSSLAGPSYLVVDSENGYLYFSDQDLGKIERVNIADGSGRTKLVDLPFGNNIGSFALDQTAQRLYWTRLEVFNDNQDGIYYQDLDVGGETKLIAQSDKNLDTLLVDPHSGKLFWSEQNDSQIYSADIGGDNVQALPVGSIGQARGIAFGPNADPVAILPASISLNEGSDLNLSAAASYDVDGGGLTYQWDLDNDGIFGEVGEPTTETATVTWSTLANFGIVDQGTFTVSIRVDDGMGGVDIASSVLTVDNVAPTIGGSVSILQPENQTNVMVVNATDPVDAVTYSLIGGDDRSAFEIDQTTGQLSFKAAPDFEVPGDFDGNNVYLVVVMATDDDGATVSQSITVTITDVVEGTVGITTETDTYNIAEDNTLVRNAAFGVLANDTVFPSGPLTATLVGGDPANAFSFVFNNDGSFTYTPDANFNGTDTFQYTATDGTTTSGVTTVTIQVGVVNDAPTNLAIDNASVSENADGQVVGNLTVTDVDAGDSHTFAVSDNRFEVVGGALNLVAGQSLNFETDPTITLTIIATDSGGESFQQSFTITVGNVNETPTGVTIDRDEVDENHEDATVGLLTTNDPDAGGSHTYTVNDNRFIVDGNELKLRSGVMLDFEAEPTVSLIVTSTDQGNLSVNQSFAINVVDRNDAPTNMTLVGGTIDENVAGAIAGTLFVDDPDATATHTFTVDDARFEIIGHTLKLRDSNAIDHETESSITMTVRATDSGGLWIDRAITVAVVDVNESPSLITLSSNEIDHDVAGQTVGLVGVSDPDSGDAHSWLVDDVRFEVVAGELRLKPGQSIDGGVESTINLTLTATDVGGLNTNASFTLNVSEPETPKFRVPILPQAIVAPDEPPTSSSPAVEESSGESSESLADSEPASKRSSKDASTESGSDESGNEGSASPPLGAVGVGNGVAPSGLAGTDRDDNAAMIAGLLKMTSDETTRETGSDAGDAALAIMNDDQNGSSLDRSNSIGSASNENSRRQGSLQSTFFTGTTTQLDIGLMTKPGAMWTELDKQRNLVENRIHGDLIDVGAAGAAVSSVTVGVLAWALRSGILASGLLAQMPAWRAFDPLMIMQGVGDNADDESLEDLMSRRSEALDQHDTEPGTDT